MEKHAEKIVIAGAGTMGYSMARIFARCGYRVTVYDVVERALENAREKVGSAAESMTFTTDKQMFADCDLVVESIIEKGVVTKPYIGVTVQTVSDEASIYAAAGARVVSVTEGSPAEEAGLQENDIITAVDGEEIATSTELVTVVTGKTPGDEVVLSVYRDRRTLEIRVVVGEQVTSAEGVSENTQEQQEYPYGYGYGYGNGSGNGNGFPYGFFGGGVG